LYPRITLGLTLPTQLGLSIHIPLLGFGRVVRNFEVFTFLLVAVIVVLTLWGAAAFEITIHRAVVVGAAHRIVVFVTHAAGGNIDRLIHARLTHHVATHSMDANHTVSNEVVVTIRTVGSWKIAYTDVLIAAVTLHQHSPVFHTESMEVAQVI